MKGSILYVLMLACGLSAHAQTWEEWTQQKKTQIKYLVKQVAALQAYIDIAQKGYSIYSDGLTLIGDSKDGEFNLHENYFSSLSNVNPHVSGLPEVADMILFNQQVQVFRQRIARLELNAYGLSIRNLFDQLAGQSSDHIRQLELLISAGNYELKDKERIEQIDRLYKSMSTLYGFAKRTYQEAILESKVLPKEDTDIRIIQQLQGLK